MCGPRGDRARAGGRSLGRHLLPADGDRVAFRGVRRRHTEGTSCDRAEYGGGVGGNQWSRAGSNHAGPPGRARSSRRPLDHPAAPATLTGRCRSLRHPSASARRVLPALLFVVRPAFRDSRRKERLAARPTRPGADFRSAQTRRPRSERDDSSDYREPMRSLIVVALSLTVVAVAGCSGSDDADPTTTSGTAAPATTPAPPATESTSTTATTQPPRQRPTDDRSTDNDPRSDRRIDRRHRSRPQRRRAGALRWPGLTRRIPHLRADVARVFLRRRSRAGDRVPRRTCPRRTCRLARILTFLTSSRRSSEISRECDARRCTIDSAGSTPRSSTSHCERREAIVNDRIVRTVTEVDCR